MADREELGATLGSEVASGVPKRQAEKKAASRGASASAAPTRDRKPSVETIVLEKNNAASLSPALESKASAAPQKAARSSAAPSAKKPAASSNRKVYMSVSASKQDRENIQSSVRSSLARIHASFASHQATPAAPANKKRAAVKEERLTASAAPKQVAATEAQERPSASAAQAAAKSNANTAAAESAAAAAESAAAAAAERNRIAKQEQERQRLEKMVRAAKAAPAKAEASVERKSQESQSDFSFRPLFSAARTNQFFDSSEAIVRAAFDFLSNSADSVQNIIEEVVEFSDDWAAENIALVEKMMEAHTPADIAAYNEELNRNNIGNTLDRAKRVINLTDKCNKKLEASCYKVGKEVEELLRSLQSKE